VGAQRSVSATMRVTGPHRGIAAPAGERPAVRRAPRDDTLQVSGFPGIRESKVGVWCKSIVVTGSCVLREPIRKIVRGWGSD
jgi:hypothetical protein